MSYIKDPNYETILRRRRNKRRRRHLIHKLSSGVILAAITLTIGVGGFFCVRAIQEHNIRLPFAENASSGTENGDASSPSLYISSENFSLDDLLAQAERLAAGYDYDGAVALLQTMPEYRTNSQITQAISGYEATKATLVEADINKVTHVFFHSLIIDTSKAFDGDADSKGYNSVMTTKDEFIKILNSLYEKGFVLVRLHDMAYETTDENGNTVMQKGSILLPPGKQPLVMSQDDVCYYEYMEGDGFASRIVIGEDGKPTCEMVLDDGTVATGAYDLIPILEEFIQEHPDFSYKGARAVIALTGYNGILGYRRRIAKRPPRWPSASGTTAGNWHPTAGGTGIWEASP